MFFILEYTKKLIICIIGLCCVLAFSSQAYAKVRVAYIESGNYIDHNLILQETVKWLANMNIIQKTNDTLPISATNKERWQWLAQHVNSKQIEFVADAFYSASWNNTLLSKQIKDLRKRIITKKDIDLVFTFGNMAGLAASKRINNVNIINFSANDPLLQNISKSKLALSNSHIHTKIELSQDLQQIKLFHYLFNFKSMGICYEDSEQGRKNIAYDEIIQISKLYNFDLVEEKISTLSDDIDSNVESLKQCHKALVAKADAIYLTKHIDEGLGRAKHHIPQILQPLMENNIPSFAQSGSQNVAYGALLGMIPPSFDDVGYFEASVIKQMLDGKKPHEINQIFDGGFSIALNLAMAESIGWPISLDILSALDQVYFQIQ